jgi:RNA polymerase sigma-70 factor (ECF subfamily)
VVDRCFATARIILGDSDRAHDAVQEALVRCWRDLPSLRDPDRFDGWLRRLLMHAIADEFRRGRRFAAKVQILHEHPTMPDDVWMVDDRDQIARALQGISVDHRAIVTLYYLHGLPIAEVADALGIPEGTAKSRLHYATQAIRAELAARERIATTKVSA